MKQSIITILSLLLIYSCQLNIDSIKKMQENDKKFSRMLDSCKYNLVVNNLEQKHILSFKYENNGCVKVIFPIIDRNHIAKWDTGFICGNFAITKLK